MNMPKVVSTIQNRVGMLTNKHVILDSNAKFLAMLGIMEPPGRRWMITALPRSIVQFGAHGERDPHGGWVVVDDEC